MSTEQKIRVVGIGSAGIRMLEEVENLGLLNVVTIGIDTDIDTLRNSNVEKKLPLKSDDTIHGTGGNTKAAKAVAEVYIQYLAKVVHNAKKIIILAGLGGGTASMIAPILTKIADKSTSIISITAIPMEVEGKSKINIAKKSFEFLKEKSNLAIELSNDIVLANSTEGIENAYKNANTKVAQIVELIAAGFSSSAFLKIEEQILVNSFAKKRVYAGCATAQLQNIEAAFLEIKTAPTMECDLKSQNMLVAIKCPKSYSMADIKNILQTARNSFDVNDKIFYSVCSSSDTKDVKILVIASKYEEQKKQIVIEESPQILDIQESTRPAEISNSSIIDDDIEQNYNEPEISTQEKNLVVDNEQTPKNNLVEFKPDTKPKDKEVKKEQMTFEFDERGLFENTPRNERKGVDIDIPTFTRKRIKITLL
ncbi:MAG: hypothetical protein J6B07_03710 [Opitutales bacterium]|nr:hypothetical protein [Opitutales bacterium]